MSDFFEPEVHIHKWELSVTGDRYFSPASGSVDDNINERVICSICGVEMPEQPPARATPDDVIPI